MCHAARNAYKSLRGLYQRHGQPKVWFASYADVDSITEEGPPKFDV